MSKIQGKDVRPKETPNKDFDPSMYSFGSGRDLLSLEPALQKAINEAGLDRRFMDSTNFRKKGGSGSHSNRYWRAFNISDLGLQPGTYGSTPEGTIVRDTLVLAVRDKRISAIERAQLAEENAKLSGQRVQKSEAAKLKEHAKNIGVSEQMTVHEGFEDDQKTKKGAYREVATPQE